MCAFDWYQNPATLCDLEGRIQVVPQRFSAFKCPQMVSPFVVLIKYNNVITV